MLLVTSLALAFFTLFHASFALSQSPPPPTADELDSLFAVRLVNYEQEDKSDGSAGNRYIDEDASIQEGVLLVRKRLNPNHAIEGKFTGVIVTAASWDDARLKAETISGATTDDHGRLNANVGWLYKNNQGFSGALHLNYGSEYTYRTEGLSLSLGQTFNEGSTVLGLKLIGFNDRVRNIRFDGKEFNQESRDTYTVDASLVQTIDAISHVNLSWSHTDQKGFLATSYNAVFVGDTFDSEKVPDKRKRDALSVRYRRALKRDAYQLGYSYYWDNWGINSNITEARYYWNVPKTRLQVQTSARYYHQSSADFYAPEFESPQPFQTSDSDLGDFSGKSVGILLSASSLPGLFRYDATYEVGLNYYKRSDDLDFYWLTVGWLLR